MVVQLKLVQDEPNDEETPFLPLPNRHQLLCIKDMDTTPAAPALPLADAAAKKQAQWQEQHQAVGNNNNNNNALANGHYSANQEPANVQVHEHIQQAQAPAASPAALAAEVLPPAPTSTHQQSPGEDALANMSSPIQPPQAMPPPAPDAEAESASAGTKQPASPASAGIQQKQNMQPQQTHETGAAGETMPATAATAAELHQPTQAADSASKLSLSASQIQITPLQATPPTLPQESLESLEHEKQHTAEDQQTALAAETHPITPEAEAASAGTTQPGQTHASPAASADIQQKQGMQPTNETGAAGPNDQTMPAAAAVAAHQPTESGEKNTLATEQNQSAPPQATPHPAPPPENHKTAAETQEQQLQPGALSQSQPTAAVSTLSGACPANPGELQPTAAAAVPELPTGTPTPTQGVGNANFHTDTKTEQTGGIREETTETTLGVGELLEILSSQEETAAPHSKAESYTAPVAAQGTGTPPEPAAVAGYAAATLQSAESYTAPATAASESSAAAAVDVSDSDDENENTFQPSKLDDKPAADSQASPNNTSNSSSSSSGSDGSDSDKEDPEPPEPEPPQPKATAKAKANPKGKAKAKATPKSKPQTPKSRPKPRAKPKQKATAKPKVTAAKTKCSKKQASLDLEASGKDSHAVAMELTEQLRKEVTRERKKIERQRQPKIPRKAAGQDLD